MRATEPAADGDDVPMVRHFSMCGAPTSAMLQTRNLSLSSKCEIHGSVQSRGSLSPDERLRLSEMRLLELMEAQKLSERLLNALVDKISGEFSSLHRRFLEDPVAADSSDSDVLGDSSVKPLSEWFAEQRQLFLMTLPRPAKPSHSDSVSAGESANQATFAEWFEDSAPSAFLNALDQASDDIAQLEVDTRMRSSTIDGEEIEVEPRRTRTVSWADDGEPTKTVPRAPGSGSVGFGTVSVRKLAPSRKGTVVESPFAAFVLERMVDMEEQISQLTALAVLDQEKIEVQLSSAASYQEQIDALRHKIADISR
uniref:Uncharacterized protein n=1 Tax=Noctiluca scintillans TaxID=2966 RepID=A0A7S1F1Y7_NOCSC|eukprot:CAMPEP_0194542630 /NCGR_PEP_ID=MMETSP0253-20130528/84360_1 /TAXON_ID=2966 /ORGANISM="Noctiluca scintillans" /LENGTH=310 /DNA_ID=CAMNT_0039389277 /DNA_START=1 /DNA_END=933 /DNA_ORIENTATION=-